MENFERIKELVDELKKIIDEMDRNRPFQSEVSKSFQQKLHEKMEKKYSEAEEIRERLKIEDVL